MAIKGATPNQNANQSTMGSAFAQASQQQQAQQPQGGGFSFRNMNGMQRNAMSRNQASEVLSKLSKAVGEVLKENVDQSFETTLIPIDMNSTVSLGVSVLVVALRDKTQLDLGVAFHTLILEASADAPTPRFDNINGQNVEILRVTGDADDKILADAVIEALGKQFPNTRVLNAGSCVVPRDFNMADQNAIFRLTANAAFADSSELETSAPGFVDLNLANAERDANLTVRTTFGNPETLDAVQQPVRSDIVIDFSAAPVNQTANQQQAVERVSQIATVRGFMDLVWDPIQAAANPYQPYGAQQQSYQRYAVRFVMTTMESQSLLTIPAQLLALMPALSLRENNAWIQAFRPTAIAGNEFDMHDIGAIGIECNFENNPAGYGIRVDTKKDSFKPEHLGLLVTAAIRPGLILSLDVSECGPDTSHNGVFAAAAENNARANEAIINAANHLTNGLFAKYFPANGRVANDEYNRIHMGHYEDRQGIKRDLRNVDHLAILNMIGEKDPAVARDWSDTFARTNFPLNQRLAARKRILMGLFNNVVITGFARRVTFEPAFIEALVKGSQEAGLVVRAVSPYTDSGNYERAISPFASQSLMSNESTGLFNRGGFGQPTQGMGANRSFGHW